MIQIVLAILPSPFSRLKQNNQLVVLVWNYNSAKSYCSPDAMSFRMFLDKEFNSKSKPGLHKKIHGANGASYSNGYSNFENVYSYFDFLFRSGGVHFSPETFLNRFLFAFTMNFKLVATRITGCIFSFIPQYQTIKIGTSPNFLSLLSTKLTVNPIMSSSDGSTLPSSS